MSVSNSLLKAVDANWPDGIIEFDSGSIITQINDKVEQLLGWSEKELVGLPVHKALCSLSINTDHDELNCPIKLFGNSDTSVKEVIWVHKNQSNIAIRYRQQAFQAEEPSLGGFIVFQTCENLGFNLRELNKLAKLTDVNPTPLLEVDSQGLILFSNPAMTELMLEYGFDDDGRPNVLPQNLAKLAQSCLDVGLAIDNLESKAKDSEDESPIKYFLWSCHPIINEERESVLLCGIDISNKKELEIQQIIFNQMLEEEKLKTRKEYLNKMVHELRTPLNLVVGYAGLLKQKLREHCSTLQLSLFDQIIDSGMRLADQISATLKVDSVEAGILSAEFTEYLLNVDMLSVVNSMEIMAAEKGLALTVDIPHEPLMIVADKQQIKQIVINLLSNAIK